MITFIYATDGISCASAIMKFINTSNNLEFNLALVSGKPVDEEGSAFFEVAKAKINKVCSLGLNKKMYLDIETILISEKEIQEPKEKLSNFTVLNNDDFVFSSNLHDVIKKHFTRSDFNSGELISEIGLSKSQVSRKVKSLTGLAPNQLIQESRLQSALNNIASSHKTIAEIAYDTGFNSPTYFTRVFKKRFGILPTDFTKQLR